MVATSDTILSFARRKIFEKLRCLSVYFVEFNSLPWCNWAYDVKFKHVSIKDLVVCSDQNSSFLQGTLRFNESWSKMIQRSSRLQFALQFTQLPQAPTLDRRPTSWLNDAKNWKLYVIGASLHIKSYSNLKPSISLTTCESRYLKFCDFACE